LFRHLPPDHIHFVSVHDADDKPIGNKMLKPDDNLLEIAAPAETTKAHATVSTFPGFLKLGVEHIWTGYDHLMFLLALLLVCADFKSAVQVVTFFTVAHSITLAFATLNLVSVSSRVVEPAIAASIIYVGVENFVRKEGPKGRWLITFLFGLIHGFGFATVLRDMGVASSTTGVTVPLVAFNLGVEMGQIVIAAVLLPIIWQLRKWESFRRRGVPACSAVVAAVGAYWLFQRVFFA
jgi:hydrogenase/urease accessory protein HupE